MVEIASDETIRRISVSVAERFGLYFPPERWSDLRRGIAEACKEFNLTGEDSCVETLLSSQLTREQQETLASYLTIGETYFFREQKSFDALMEHVLPGLLAARRGGNRSLRIWSAGCATGEEPYSFAILLHRYFPEVQHWNLTLLASDINPRFLQKAASGIYSEWSFRGTPSWVKEQYFQRLSGGKYELRPEIRTMVNFTYLNLAEDMYPSLVNNTAAMDIILCRNVLMYFIPQTARRVIEKFHMALADGGWLSLSPTDISNTSTTPLLRVELPGVLLYRKPGTRIARPPVAVPPVATVGKAPAETPVPPRRRATAPSSPPNKPARRLSRTELSSDPLKTAATRYAQGAYGEAADLANRYLARHPNDTAAMEMLARASANQGKLDLALLWCEKAIAASKLNIGYHFLRGTILQEQGRLPEAIESLKRVLYLDPNFVMAHFGLGNLCHQQGRIPEANQHFRHALALLKPFAQDEPLPESEGITAGRLRTMIETNLQSVLAT
jgi:chemotaxis protein methyltransferase CheR